MNTANITHENATMPDGQVFWFNQILTPGECRELRAKLNGLDWTPQTSETITRSLFVEYFFEGKVVFAESVDGPFYHYKNGKTWQIRGNDKPAIFVGAQNYFALAKRCCVMSIDGFEGWFAPDGIPFTVTKKADVGKEPVFAWSCGEKSGDFSDDGKTALWEALTGSRCYMSHFNRGGGGSY